MQVNDLLHRSSCRNSSGGIIAPIAVQQRAVRAREERIALLVVERDAIRAILDKCRHFIELGCNFHLHLQKHLRIGASMVSVFFITFPSGCSARRMKIGQQYSYNNQRHLYASQEDLYSSFCSNASR